MKNLSLLVLAVCISAIVATAREPVLSGQPHPSDRFKEAPAFRAQIIVIFEKRSLSMAGILAADATRQVQSYYDKNPSFELSKLRKLRIRADDGQTFALGSLGKIEVRFQKLTEAKPSKEKTKRE
jgi:hypothetical protein